MVKSMKMKAAMKKSSKKGGMKKKAMKTSSAMRRMKKAMKVSKVGRKWQVFKGDKEKSSGGLKKSDLMKNRNGRVVSKKRSAKGKALYQKYGKAWMAACAKARKELGIKGMVPIGGKTAQGQAFLKKARSFYKK